jgi:hypothetical protein
MCCCRRIVKSRKDSGWSTFLNKVAYNFIVEIFDGRPFDFFANVFFLFSFEGQLDENLLELLVDVVDTELLKAVVLLWCPGLVA